MSDIDEKIDKIPGHDGWWKSRTRVTFYDAAAVLVCRGMSDDQAVELLQELYDAVAEEFGQ